MKKILKKEQAITLIALVITIIILLILAAVAIAQLSDSGLFKKSQESKQKWEIAQADENEKIAKYTNEMDSYLSGNREFKPLNYSTTEQDTGLKWVDNSPIYQRTIAFTNKSISQSSSYTLLSDSTVNLISAYGYIIENGTKFIIPEGGTRIQQASSGDIKLYGLDGHSFTGSGYITIQYTKIAN